jgi:hypothetical protein
MSIDLEMRKDRPPANGAVAAARVVKPLPFDTAATP